ncbi:hypothetical protein [Streptomyces sp. NPDC092129]|uniref:hypothetical protein n=1 Tax=Streptomyces sp. NPDC092129 TaxID=3366010 RepID=UPI0037F64331
MLVDGCVSQEHAVQKVHDGEIREVLNGDLGQFVRDAFQVERVADARAGIIQDAQPLTGPELVGCVDRGQGNTPHPPYGIHHGIHHTQPCVGAVLTGCSQITQS